VAHKNAFEGSADAHIVTAYAMNDAQLQELVTALEKKLGKKLKPEVSVDESLIGGFCVTVGDEVLDMSVRAKLARMQSALTA
jgi:F-type H+-transporting ATPase subunit delta